MNTYQSYAQVMAAILLMFCACLCAAQPCSIDLLYPAGGETISSASRLAVKCRLSANCEGIESIALIRLSDGSRSSYVVNRPASNGTVSIDILPNLQPGKYILEVYSSGGDVTRTKSYITIAAGRDTEIPTRHLLGDCAMSAYITNAKDRLILQNGHPTLLDISVMMFDGTPIQEYHLGPGEMAQADLRNVASGTLFISSRAADCRGVTQLMLVK